MTEELKLCPFCGGKAEFSDGAFYDVCAICTQCDATSGMYDTKEQVIKAWNRRVIDKDKQEKAMTNLDYIKTLNIDQMYKFLSMECFDWCIHNDSPECLTADCGEGIKAWLKQPPHKMFWWKVN